MKRVITYGTYDLLHYGHIRLLERAKALGDYLIVGVTADDFDKTRGKINVQQSLMERVEAVRGTGLADEIIIEEYEGQKIDDIIRYDVDIFTVGSDWKGKFDYLSEYCKVIYLPRTEGISSSEIRDENRRITFGLVGETAFLNKVAEEATYVNGLHLVGVNTNRADKMSTQINQLSTITENYWELLSKCEALYIRSEPKNHYQQIKLALESGKHVLCESPVCLSIQHFQELKELAKANNVVLFEAIKTAYSTAYSRLLLLVKSGKIGEVISVSATCTSLRDGKSNIDDAGEWIGLYEWGPTALLPVFQILGVDYSERFIVVKNDGFTPYADAFIKGDFMYKNAVGSIQIGSGIKSEGSLIVSGTKGYIYVPAPWWKTDYFEIRYENQAENRRYFYQLDGEGIRQELVAFARAICSMGKLSAINEDVSNSIIKVSSDILNKRNIFEIE